MRSLLQIVGKQQTIDNRAFYLHLDTSKEIYSLTIKQSLVQRENDTLGYIYDKLLELDKNPLTLNENLRYQLQSYSNLIAQETRRGNGTTIIVPKYVLDFIGNEFSGFEFIESDLPDQSLVIMTYQGKMTHITEHLDVGIIVTTDKDTHYDGVLIRNDYNKFYKVLQLC
jgi:putative methionine-R-sulfoxide reductase with GAF domain